MSVTGPENHSSALVLQGHFDISRSTAVVSHSPDDVYNPENLLKDRKFSLEIEIPQYEESLRTILDYIESSFSGEFTTHSGDPFLDTPTNLRESLSSIWGDYEGTETSFETAVENKLRKSNKYRWQEFLEHMREHIEGSADSEGVEKALSRMQEISESENFPNTISSPEVEVWRIPEEKDAAVLQNVRIREALRGAGAETSENVELLKEIVDAADVYIYSKFAFRNADGQAFPPDLRYQFGDQRADDDMDEEVGAVLPYKDMVYKFSPDEHGLKGIHLGAPVDESSGLVMRATRDDLRGASVSAAFNKLEGEKSPFIVKIEGTRLILQKQLPADFMHGEEGRPSWPTVIIDLEEDVAKKLFQATIPWNSKRFVFPPKLRPENRSLEEVTPELLSALFFLFMPEGLQELLKDTSSKVWIHEAESKNVDKFHQLGSFGGTQTIRPSTAREERLKQLAK